MISKGMIEKIEFHSVTHRYFFSGDELMSVTAAFKKTGIIDFSRVKTEIIEPALLIGDCAHEIAQLYGNNKLDEESVDDGSDGGYDMTGYLKAIKSFYNDNVKEVLLIEQPVVDKYNLYCGTPDLIFKNKKGLTGLIDWKTPKKPHPAWGLQTAAYKNAAEKCFSDLQINFRGGVLLRKDGSYEFHKHKCTQDFDIFLAVLKIANFKVEHKITT